MAYRIKPIFNRAGYRSVPDEQTNRLAQGWGPQEKREIALALSPMDSLLAFLAPLALLVPIIGQDDREVAESEQVQLDPKSVQAEEVSARLPEGITFEISAIMPTQNQVRIEQRVVVRISPQSTTQRQSLMADLPQRPLAPRFEERKMEKCVPVSGIAGVQTGSGNRLLLFLRDRRVVTANLEKSCRARDFYSGFYVERNKDGKLCVDRDKLQSRSGANCEIDRMRELVQVTE